jgi:uncharacterized membrane protein
MNLDVPHAVIKILVVGFELAGVAAIMLGSALACGRFAFASSGLELAARYRALRQELGGANVLGLEFLIAADIIRTVVMESTLQNVAILGVIVLIRTFLSMTLQMEIGRGWPLQWRRTEEANLRNGRTE